MLRRLCYVIGFVLFYGCDDGDVIILQLEFDQVLERCDNDTDSYLLYDTRTDPNESLTLLIPRTTENELLFTTATTVDEPTVLTIDGSTVRFNYRVYNADPSSSLCDVITNPDVVIKTNC